MPGEFHAEIQRRVVVVSCPDNGTGGAHMPPGDDESWMWPAIQETDGLVTIEGPTIGGAYVFHWEGAIWSDEEIKSMSIKILKELY
jgi:hypothetical protein